MKKFYLVIISILLTNTALASEKNKIIDNLYRINNLSFNFEQNINGKSETGNCTLQYPKKILVGAFAPNLQYLPYTNNGFCSSTPKIKRPLFDGLDRNGLARGVPDCKHE